MEKLYTSKTFLKMTDGRMHTFHPTPLDPPLAISYRNQQKSLTWLKVPPKYNPAVKSKKGLLVLRCPIKK